MTRTPVAKGKPVSWAISGPTWPVSPSSEFRPTRTRSKGPSRRRAAASARAVARVSEPAEGRIAQVHTPVRPPGHGFTEDVLGGGRSQGEDGAGAAALPGPFDALGDGTPAVGVHFELDPLPHEPAVVAQRHRLPHRNLLDQGGDPQGPLEPAGWDVVDLGHGRHDTRADVGIRRSGHRRNLRLHSGARL